MFFKKATLFVVLLAAALNISGMKREREEITQKTSSKKIKLTTPDTDLNKILQLGQRSTQPKKHMRKSTIMLFPKTISHENDAPTITTPVESIKIFINSTKDQKNSFYNAIEEKDLAAVENSLNTGINPNTIFKGTLFLALSQVTQNTECTCKETQPCMAPNTCKEKAIKISTSLLLRGAHLKPNNNDGDYSPLHYAAMETNKLHVQHLLEYGAPIDHKTGETLSTPLHLAVDNGNVETVECLLANGADKDIEDADGSTPLMIVNKNHATPNRNAIIRLLKAPSRNIIIRNTTNPFKFTRNREKTGKTYYNFLLTK